ncbi:MAG: 2-hydroxyacid dehydrogenase [Acidobacteriota bacterium]|nr:2-hydroxyacid dehydrogenase [Acidobacteriota bacterium]
MIAALMRVILHYTAGPMLVNRLFSLNQHGLSVTVCPGGDQAGLHGLLAETEVIWHVLEPVTEDVIAAAPHLRLIQKIGVGVNAIDLDAAARRKIAVCNMPGTNTQAVAEMTLLLMLSCLRRVSRLDTATRDGRGWSLPAAEQDAYGEIAGRTVGLIGFGAVPRRLAPVLQALGARVLYWSRSAPSTAVGEPRSFSNLLTESDIVSLHVPLTDETTRLIDSVALDQMKPGALLVNTARGPLVDEGAMVEALRSGHLRAAGLDVFEQEPTPADNPVLRLPNVVVSPHVAWLTEETMERSLAVAVENCRRLGAGEELLHQVV